MLHITVELEQIMREKDKYRETIDRILAFRGGGSKQNRQILVDNLAKICQRAASDLNKRVRFVAREIDNGALQSGLRRPIKEILTQLVRNSVVHGIEDPASRLKEGKAAEGLINLSITVDDGKVHIRLKDDGKGLDFDVIRERALEMKLLNEAGSHDKNLLLRTLFSPGFSTAEDVNVHAGRGVGLSLVQGRLRELQGRIRVNTRQGKGTTFHIFIPLEAAV